MSEYSYWLLYPSNSYKSINNFLNRNQTGEEPLVDEAASEFRNYCYNYRDSLVAGIIVAGYDEKQGGQVYCVPLGGMLVRQNCTIGGSGSSYVYGFIQEFFKENMEQEECVNFVKKSNLFFIFKKFLPLNLYDYYFSCFPCNVQ